MSIRNVLVAYNGTPSSDAALDYAATLVGDDDGYVTALLAHAAHETYSESRWVPPEVRKIIESANADIIAGIEAQFEEHRSRLSLGERLSLQVISGRVDSVIAQCARAYDFLVIGEAGSEAVDNHVVVHPDQVALQSGRPLLIVPKDHNDGAAGNHAVVAWDGRRAVARALSDAMRILEDNGRVTLLTIGDLKLARPVEEVMTHLERHGVTANHVHLSGDNGVANAVIGYCGEHRPDLLVMGAYEHSKFRADIVGTVTSKVLKGCPSPVLMSH